MTLLLHSCVLEERIHFKEDMSGFYELSFAFVQDDEMSEENGGMDDDGIGEIEKIFNEVKTIEGVDDEQMEVTKDGFNIEMAFKDLNSLNQIFISTKDVDGRSPMNFVKKNNRLQVGMKVMDEEDADSSDGEDMDKYFKHRIIVTFEKKIKGFRGKGFNKN